MGMCRELLTLNHPPSQENENREEGTKFLRKTEYGGGGLMDLWFQKAQGITYPGGL